MKNAFFYFLLMLILCSCGEYWCPPEIVSVEYVNEDICKIGYRGQFTDSQYDFFKNLIAENSDGSNFYSCRGFEYVEKITFSWTKTYHVLWRANKNWDQGKTVGFHYWFCVNGDFIGFKVP